MRYYNHTLVRTFMPALMDYGLLRILLTIQKLGAGWTGAVASLAMDDAAPNRAPDGLVEG